MLRFENTQIALCDRLDPTLRPLTDASDVQTDVPERYLVRVVETFPSYFQVGCISASVDTINAFLADHEDYGAIATDHLGRHYAATMEALSEL